MARVLAPFLSWDDVVDGLAAPQAASATEGDGGGILALALRHMLRLARMPLKVEDVVKVDELKEELHEGLQQLDRTLRSVFGQLSYGLITVVDRYNGLEGRAVALEAQLATISERLLRLEQQLGGPH